MSAEKTREAFESFISAPPFEKSVDRYPDRDTESWRGQYKLLDVQLAWESWQESQTHRRQHSQRWVRRVKRWMELISDMKKTGVPKHLQHQATQVQKEIANYLEHGVPQQSQPVPERALKIDVTADGHSAVTWHNLPEGEHVLCGGETGQRFSEPGWTPCSERLPTEADADCEGNVWACTSLRPPSLTHWTEAEILGAEGKTPKRHWKPTGLKRPEPPEDTQ